MITREPKRLIIERNNMATRDVKWRSKVWSINWTFCSVPALAQRVDLQYNYYYYDIKRT